MYIILLLFALCRFLQETISVSSQTIELNGMCMSFGVLCKFVGGWHVLSLAGLLALSCDDFLIDFMFAPRLYLVFNDLQICKSIKETVYYI